MSDGTLRKLHVTTDVVSTTVETTIDVETMTADAITTIAGEMMADGERTVLAAIQTAVGRKISGLDITTLTVE